MNKIPKGRVVVMIFLVTTLITFSIIAFYSSEINFPITSFAVKDEYKENLGNLPIQDSPIEKSLPEIFQNITNTSQENPVILSGKGSSRNTQTQGFRVLNLKENYQLYYQNSQISANDLFQGRVRFKLYINQILNSEFDVVFTKDIDVSEIIASTDLGTKKSLINYPINVLENVDLFVPRTSQDFQVKVCQNPTSLNQVDDSCEELIDLTDASLSITDDQEFFRIQDVQSIGAISQESTPQKGITLLSPPSTIPNNNTNITFQFIITGKENLLRCELYIDNQNTYNWINPELENSLKYILNGISTGKHNWQVKCLDQEQNTLESQIKQLTVFSASIFGGRTTDLSTLENLQNVTNFTLEGVGKGLIQFDEPVDLSQGIDLNSFIKIEHNFISINSEMLPQLNKSATLTFFDLNLENAVILRDGKVCTDCQIIDNNGDLTFKVSHFSSYTATSNSQLLIYDSSDSSIANPNDQVYFYANFTNFTSSAPIQGGGTYCNITLPNSSPINMIYNSSSGLYEYNSSFSTAGTYLFNVQCIGSPLGFADFNINDTYTISPTSSQGVNGVTVTSGISQSGGADPASSEEAIAGNVTEVTISGYSTTQSWQGYYGGVSGTIELTDSNDNIFYNWSLVQPEGEVYASTISTLSWNDIQCFNFTAAGIYGEESGLGGTTNQNGTNLEILEAQFNIGQSDVDGINETFSEQNHDLFYTSGKAFSQDECQSTHVFTQSGAIDGTFQEVLLYEPVSSAIIFTSILEKPNATGFNGNGYTFEMLVLEDGHSGDTATTPYYFFIEIE